MQIRQLPVITYETLAKKFKNITVSSYHDAKGISVLHVLPKNGARIEPDIFTFENDILITSDVALKTKDGKIRQIFTNFYNNGVKTNIKEFAENFKETIIDKTIIPLAQIRKTRKGSYAKDLSEKARGYKIDGTIPVSITKKEVITDEVPTSIQYTVSAKGEKNSLRLISEDKATRVVVKGDYGVASFDLGDVENPQKKSYLNEIFDWFIKEHKGMQ